MQSQKKKQRAGKKKKGFIYKKMQEWNWEKGWGICNVLVGDSFSTGLTMYFAD